MTAIATNSRSVVNGRVVRCVESERIDRVELDADAWRALGVGPGDRVVIETRAGYVIAAEVVADGDGRLAICVRGGLIGYPARTVRVRRPRNRRS